MKLADVPKYPAYLVFHDAFDKGAMDVYPRTSFVEAQAAATARNEALEQSGNDEGGHWKAYEKLPRVKIWRFHS